MEGEEDKIELERGNRSESVKWWRWEGEGREENIQRKRIKIFILHVLYLNKLLFTCRVVKRVSSVLEKKLGFFGIRQKERRRKTLFEIQPELSTLTKAAFYDSNRICSFNFQTKVSKLIQICIFRK